MGFARYGCGKDTFLKIRCRTPAKAPCGIPMSKSEPLIKTTLSSRRDFEIEQALYFFKSSAMVANCSTAASKSAAMISGAGQIGGFFQRVAFE